MRLLVGMALLICVVALGCYTVQADLPAGNRPTGPLAGQPGTWVLPNGRLITPAGRQATLGNFPLGLAASPDGRYLFVVNNGVGPQSVQVVESATGDVVQTVPVPTVFNGIVVSPDGARIWAAGGGANAVLAFTFAAGRLTQTPSLPVLGYPTGLALAPDGKTLLVTCNLTRHVVVLDTVRRREVGRIPAGMFPFAIALSPNGRKAYATNWGDGTVSVQDTQTRSLLKTIPTGGLPCAVVLSPDGRRAYIANANTDTVSVLETTSDTKLADISVAPYPHAPNGSIPNGLALSPKGDTLYVTLAGINAVVAYDTRTYRPVRAYPVGWYPTGILCARDGRALFVVNSKGVGSGPNKNGAYIGHMMHGTLSVIPTHTVEDGFAQVARNNGYDRHSRQSALPAAITHCVLIVRENRTYDQLLGDRTPGNGDPTLTVFGRQVTPNLHALVSRFALGDNFYSDGEVSAQGHAWTLGAICPDYIEKTWMAYASSRGRLRDTPFAPITYPALGFCIDHCVRNGVSCRMYGDVVRIDAHGKPLPAVADKFDPNFQGWNLNYPDVQRAAEWVREFRRGIFPAFSYIWLPNDHTAGTQLGSKTPRAMVADNDEATGMILDALSHSKYWRETAVFLCEDDSQDGRDHVDAHRNVLLVASPWVRPGAISSHHYGQTSIYATIERLLHLPPMSQYDDLSDPITDIWAAAPDLRPYTKLAAQVPTDERNTTRSAMWRESAHLDLEEADADKTGLLEEILWRTRVTATRKGRN